MRRLELDKQICLVSRDQALGGEGRYTVEHKAHGKVSLNSKMKRKETTVSSTKIFEAEAVEHRD